MFREYLGHAVNKQPSHMEHNSTAPKLRVNRRPDCPTAHKSTTPTERAVDKKQNLGGNNSVEEGGDR
jgi:hypothetical protein